MRSPSPREQPGNPFSQVQAMTHRASFPGSLAVALILVAGFLLPWALFADPLAGQTPDEAELAGAWAGELQIAGGPSLPLIFHIEAGKEGRLTVTMDSPSQGVRGVAVESVRFEAGRLFLELPALGARYEGELEADERFTGSWHQGGMELPLVLERTEEGAVESRPQDPTPPFPYVEEEILYPNESAGIELAGTLTLPEGDGPFPAVALITGSGAQDRDQALVGHRPFLVLADHLTRAGIAVLRSDDRGVGGSGGDFATSTSRDFAEDAAAAVAYLRTRPEVDPEAVGLVGHSEGGMIAPMVALEWGGVDFVVLLAGPAIPGSELLRMQGAAIARAMGADEDEVEAAGRSQTRIFEAVLEEEEESRRVARVRAVLEEALADSDPEELQARGIPAGGEEAWVDGQVQMARSDWFRSFLMYDPRVHLSELQVPVLALFGEKDLQVPPEENRAALEEALREAENPDVTIHVLSSLNHLFQTAETGSPMEYAQIEETFAPVALEAVSSWILALTAGRR
jgi:uncharacterized protein